MLEAATHTEGPTWRRLVWASSPGNAHGVGGRTACERTGYSVTGSAGGITNQLKMLSHGHIVNDTGSNQDRRLHGIIGPNQPAVVLRLHVRAGNVFVSNDVGFAPAQTAEFNAHNEHNHFTAYVQGGDGVHLRLPPGTSVGWVLEEFESTR